jgi:hypothetical protein
MKMVTKELEAMMFEINIKNGEIRKRVRNIKRIRRERCIHNKLEKMKLKLENKQ